MNDITKELLEHLKDRPSVDLIKIRTTLSGSYDADENYIKKYATVSVSLPEVLSQLDSADWENADEIVGFIWYADGSWSERDEYDGREWWEYQYCPPRDIL